MPREYNYDTPLKAGNLGSTPSHDICYLLKDPSTNVIENTELKYFKHSSFFQNQFTVTSYLK